MIKRPPIFSSFGEYWYYTKYLSRKQRKIIFKSLPSEQKTSLDNSYVKDCWGDLFYHNEIDEKINELEQEYGYNLYSIRAKAYKGKSVYVPTKFWEVAIEQMGQYKPEINKSAIGGLMAIECKENSEVCLIIHEKYLDSGTFQTS